MLKKLGTVLHRTPNGYIVARLEKEDDTLPPLNTIVYDENVNRVGVLLDIIGSVSSPYAVVKPSSPNVKVEAGTRLYYRPPTPRRGKGRGKPRRKPSGRRAAASPRQKPQARPGRGQRGRQQRGRGGGGGGRPQSRRDRRR